MILKPRHAADRQLSRLPLMPDDGVDATRRAIGAAHGHPQPRYGKENKKNERGEQNHWQSDRQSRCFYNK